MSYSQNGIININGSDYTSLGTLNVFTDVLNQFGTTVVGYQNVINGITTADSMILGNKNSLNDALNSGIIGQSCTIQPGGCQNTFIIAGNSVALDPMIDGDISHHTLVGGRYVMMKENIKTSTGALTTGPKYIQAPGVAGIPTGTLDNRGNTVPNGALTFDTAANNLYIHKAGSWVKNGTVNSVALSAPPEFTVSGSPVIESGTLTFTKAAQPMNYVYAGPLTPTPAAPTFRPLTLSDVPFSWQTLEQVLQTGSSTGNYTILVDLGQNISFSEGIHLSNGGVVGTCTNNNIGIGLNIESTGALHSVAIGRAAKATQNYSTSLGCDAQALHNTSTALGAFAATTATNQIMLGTVNDYVQVPNYIKSTNQKACAGGITPGVSALQAITTGSGNITLLIKDVLFDWFNPMISGNDILLDDLQQVWTVSALMRGTFATNPTSQTFSATMIWYNGTTDKIIGQQDAFVAANAPTFNITISTTMKTNSNPGQYIRCALNNTTNATMNITHYRFSTIRIA